LALALLLWSTGAALAAGAPPLPSTAAPDTAGDRVYLVHKPFEEEFQVISKFNDREQVIWSFSLKDWGTWNIYWLALSDNPEQGPTTAMNNRRQIAGGGTDWEYVYRGGPVKSGAMEWMGGNHGNEDLISLTLIGDGEKIDLKRWPGGRERTFSQVQIREETRLINSNMDGEVAAIVRLYEVVPNGLRLTTTTEWLQDTWLDIGYAAMYPISKTYGRYWQFAGYDKVYSVPGPGQTTNRFYGFVDTTETVFWGDDDPKIRTRSWIADRAAVLDWKYTADKTRVWDIGASQVKLYYAVFSNKGAVLMPRGTRWEVLRGWDIWREAGVR
jgi:hypothetical protein